MKLILIGLTVDGIFHVQISIPSTDIYLALIALGTRVVGGDTRARDGAPFLIKSWAQLDFTVNGGKRHSLCLLVRFPGLGKDKPFVPSEFVADHISSLMFNTYCFTRADVEYSETRQRGCHGTIL